MSGKMEAVNRNGKELERLDQARIFAPAVDIFENQEEILLAADMPGVTLETVKIHFEKNQLSMEGTCTCLPDHDTDPGFTYARKFVVPGGIDADRITADLKNGVLTLHLPKHDALRPRQISVSAG